MQYKRSKIIVLAFLVLSLNYNIKAQETKTLTLTEAIDLGVRNSKQLQLSKARIDEAVAATREATQKRLPDANVGANFMYIGCLFLICVPFILIFIKKAKAKVNLAEAGH